MYPALLFDALSRYRRASQFSLLPNAAFDQFNLDTDYITPSSHIINVTAMMNRWFNMTLQLTNKVEATLTIVEIVFNFN